MTQETFAMLFTALTLVVTVINLYSTRQDLEKQRQATRELATLTSDLETQVQRLTRELDQRIVQLSRARDLVNNLFLTFERIRAHEQVGKEQVNVSDVVEAMTITIGSVTELTAIANSIADKEMMLLVRNLNEAMAALQGEGRPDESEYMTLRQVTTHLHLRIYRLMLGNTDPSDLAKTASASTPSQPLVPSDIPPVSPASPSST